MFNSAADCQLESSLHESSLIKTTRLDIIWKNYLESILQKIPKEVLQHSNFKQEALVLTYWLQFLFYQLLNFSN